MGASDKPRQIPLDLGHTAGSLARGTRCLGCQPASRRLDRRLAGLAGNGRRARWSRGVGKIALASIWAESANAIFVEPSEIEGWVEDAPARPVAIDDADVELDENGLFHLINAAKAAGTHVLLTSRLFPSGWGVRLPDLASRLKAAATVEILEPDDHLLAAVITKLFADRQVEVEPHVVQFLVRRIERSLSTAIDVVDRLDRAALEQKTRITRALAAQTVNALDRGQPELDLDDCELSDPRHR